jgi:hypothetical protein
MTLFMNQIMTPPAVLSRNSVPVGVAGVEACGAMIC